VCVCVCVAFVGSAYVKGLVRSNYFLQSVVLMSILFAYSLVLMGESAFGNMVSESSDFLFYGVV